MFEFTKNEDAIQKLNSLPSSILDDVSHLIQEFNTTAVKDLNQKYIYQVIDELTNCYFMLPYTIKHSINFFRVRPSKDWKLFEHIDDLKYPPIDKIKLGRANDLTSSMFYAASSPETAFAECRLKENDLFFMGEYTINSNKTKPFLHVLGDFDNIRRRSKTVLDDEHYLKAYQDILNNIKPDIKLALQLVDAFFVDWFSKKGNSEDYKVTSAIIREFFKANNLSCVLYPSVEHPGGYNYVFTAKDYDDFIVPKKVLVGYVEKNYGYGAYSIKQSQYYTINEASGKIELDSNVKDVYLLLKKK